MQFIALGGTFGAASLFQKSGAAIAGPYDACPWGGPSGACSGAATWKQKGCDPGGGMQGCSQLALHHDFAEDLVVGVPLLAQCSGRHSAAMERRFCQALTGVPQKTSPANIPLIDIGSGFQDKLAIFDVDAAGLPRNRLV